MGSSRCAGIVVADAALRGRGAALSARTGCVLLEGLPDDDGADALYLHVDHDGLALGPAGARAPRLAPEWRLRPRAPRRDPLLRAAGKAPRHVLDACAGFGDDAFALACAGHRVTACEREPVVFELLAQAHERALAHDAMRPAAERIELHRLDAREWLAATPEPPDTVLLDPMFPPKRRRSALPRLAMQRLQQLVGEDGEEGEESEALSLLERAAEVAVDRVVWKRPAWSPAHGRPTASHGGKLVRFDVYVGGEWRG